MSIVPTSQTMIKFKDGSEVSEQELAPISWNLIGALEDNRLAVFELFKMCEKSSYKFMPQKLTKSVVTLKKWKLIDKEEQVSSVVKNIVLNCVVIEGFSITVINPLEV